MKEGRGASRSTGNPDFTASMSVMCRPSLVENCVNLSQQDWRLRFWETWRFWLLQGDDESVCRCPQQEVHEMVKAPSGEASCGEELHRYKNKRHLHGFCLLVRSSSLVVWWVIIKHVLAVKRFVRKGVPNEHRARIWMAASGAQEQLESKPGYYQSLLDMEHDTKLKETIHTGAPKLSQHTACSFNA